MHPNSIVGFATSPRLDVDVANKLQAINELREFCTSILGVNPKLKETKDFVDYLRNKYLEEEIKRTLAKKIEAIQKALDILTEAGITPTSTLVDLLEDYKSRFNKC